MPTLPLQVKTLVQAQGEDSRDGRFRTWQFLGPEADGKAFRFPSTALRRV